MGIVNLYKGLNSEREIFTFNGRLKDNLDLDWDHAKIIKNGGKLTPDYALQDNEILIIQEFPGSATALLVTSIVLAVISLGVGIGVGIYADIQAKEAQREMEEALKRLGKDNKQKDVTSIPQLADARNEKMDGKNVPIILGRHLFAPYFLSEPYMRPEGTDGEDLYWYGSFLVGQSGLCFEKIRNGTINLVADINIIPASTRIRDFVGRYITGSPVTSITYNLLLDQGGRFGDTVIPPNTNITLRKEFILANHNYKIIIPGFGELNASLVYNWNGTIGQNIEINGLVSDTPQRGKFKFFNPDGAEPPFYDPENFIEIVQKGNEELINKFTEERFEQKWVNSLDSSVELGRKKKDNAKVVNENGQPDENGIYMDDDGEEPVIRPTARFPMRAEIEIFFPEGLYSWDSKNGEATDATVDIILEWSKTGNDDDYTPFTEGANGQWKYRNLKRAGQKQMRFLAEIDFPAGVYTKSGEPVFIRATRKTRIHTGTYRSRAVLSAIRTRQYNPNKSTDTRLIPAININNDVADKFCRLGIKLKVNKNTQEFMDRFNVIVSMTGRTASCDWVEGRWAWNGEWSTVKTKTSNSAAVLLELITGLIHEPSKHKDSELDQKIQGDKIINLYSFGKLYEYCMNRKVEIKKDTVATEKFTLECNGVLTSGTRKIDAIQSILATCDAGIYIDEFGKLEVYYEDTQTTPIALLNPQRIAEMVDRRSLERKTDGYAVEFVDQDSDFAQMTHRILRPNIVEVPGLTTYSSMKLDFTTSYNQAMWHARRLLAKEEHRPGELQCMVGKEGRYYKPGSLIKVQHERFKIGLGSGEIVQLIKDGNQIVGLKLMEKFDISDVRDYWVEYFVVDGDKKPRVVQKQIKSVGQYTDTLLFTAPIDINSESKDIPVFGNILSAMYADGLNTGKIWEAKRYIVTDLSENELGYDLTLAEYAEEIYQTGEIGERKSSILNAPPMVLADQRISELELLVEAQRVNGSPQAIDQIVRGATETAVAERTPRFRGVYYRSGLEDGTINGDKMNLNDWVYFAKGGLGDWAGSGEDYVWQWTATGWEKRPRPSQDPTYGWLYLDAVSSAEGGKITGTNLGLFGDVFCEALTSELAFITNLFLQSGIIRYDPVSGKIGSIKTDGFTDRDGAVPGFFLGFKQINGQWQGLIETNNIRTKNMNAIGGNFQSITVDKESTLLGTVRTGPVFISNENTTPVSPTVFNLGTQIRNIRSFLGGDGTFNINGSYGGRSDLISLITATVQTVGNTSRYSLRLIFSSGADVTFEDTASIGVGGNLVMNYATISQQLSIGGSTSGKVFRIDDLPTGGAGLPPGSVYRQGNQLMIV